MEERTSKQLRELTVLVGWGAAAGLIYMPFISEIATPLLGLKFGVQGMLITLLVFGFEFFVAQGPMSEPLRRAPFAVVFLAKTVITTLLIVVAYGLGGLVLFPNPFATARPCTIWRGIPASRSPWLEFSSSWSWCETSSAAAC